MKDGLGLQRSSAVSKTETNSHGQDAHATTKPVGPSFAGESLNLRKGRGEAYAGTRNR